MTTERHPNCRTCAHPDRGAIELELAGGASINAVAKKRKLAPHLLYRHWRHVPAERKANLVLGPVQREALAARISEESSNVIDHYRAIRAGLYELFSGALNAADFHSGAILAGRLHENLHAVSELTGELTRSPLISNTLNVTLVKGHVITDPHDAARAWAELCSTPTLDMDCLTFEPREAAAVQEARP